jgi:hypothetical protein
MVRHHWSTSTSFVLAALRALHIDPSGAVTKSAMIEEGTSSPWTWHVARTHRKRPSGRGNYDRGSLNRPTFMPGGPLFIDLPETGPVPGSTGAVAHGGARGFLESRRDTIIALTPFAALALFFTTGYWMWFLMVPVMGILLYGPDGGRNPRLRRYGGRDRDR